MHRYTSEFEGTPEGLICQKRYISAFCLLASAMELTYIKLHPHESGPLGCSSTLVYPSMRLSNFSYAVGASSSPTSWDTTNDGFALPDMIKSRRYLL